MSLPAVAQAAAPSISVAPTSGDSGAGLTVSGSGWTAGDTIEVDIGGSQVCQLVADVSGNLSGSPSTPCQVPSGLPAGSQSLTAKDLTDGVTQATGSAFTVTPFASFTAPTSVAYGSAVNLDASQSQGAITKYLWDFGDGTTASTTTPTTNHTYSKVGGYVITLTVVDSSGNTDSTGQSVSVTGSAPTASFSAPAEQPTGTTLNFDGSGSTTPNAGATITSYSWDFGDGSSSTLAQPTHSYAAAGTYAVTLTVTDSAGETGSVTHNVVVDDRAPAASFTAPGPQAVGTAVAFDGSTSSDPDGTIVSYDWNWGDGTSDGTTASPSHTFSTVGTFSVTLTVTDNSGNTNSVTHDVTITGSAPTAFFTQPPEKPTGTTLSFDGTGSRTTNSGGTITSYDWSWGDGTPDGAGATPNHSYAAAGSYTVILTVTDSAGETSAPFSQTFIVDDRPPVASFTPTSATTAVGTPVDFSSTSSDSDGSIASYDWNWGDGTADGTTASPSHTFSATGTYPVTLTVTDNSGNATSVTHDVVVSGNVPTARFTAPSSSPTGSLVTFNGSASTPAPGEQITSYDWSWGDGTSDGNGSIAQHSYATAGSYMVTLTVTDSAGLTNTRQHQITITDRPPVAAFNPTAATVLAGSHVAFDGTQSSDPDGSIASYAWSFGDGSSSTASQPSHAYATTGTFNVTLTVTDNAGNTSTATHQVTVIAPPPMQTLILTPVASPSILKWARVSATRSGVINLGQRLFCPGPGPRCMAFVIATSRALLHRPHATRVNHRAIAGSANISIPPNGSAEVTFRLSKRAFALLRKQHRLPVQIKITVVRGNLTMTKSVNLIFVG